MKVFLYNNLIYIYFKVPVLLSFLLSFFKFLDLILLNGERGGGKVVSDRQFIASLTI